MSKDHKEIQKREQQYQINTYDNYAPIEQQVQHYEDLFVNEALSFDKLKETYKKKYVMTAQEDMELQSMDELFATKSAMVNDKIEKYNALKQDRRELRRVSKSKYSKNSTEERKEAFAAAKRSFEQVDNKQKQVKKLIGYYRNPTDPQYWREGKMASTEEEKKRVESRKYVDDIEKNSLDIHDRKGIAKELPADVQESIKSDFMIEAQILRDNLEILNLRNEGMIQAATGKELSASQAKAKSYAADLKIAYAKVGVLDEFIKKYGDNTSVRGVFLSGLEGDLGESYKKVLDRCRTQRKKHEQFIELTTEALEKEGVKVHEYGKRHSRKNQQAEPQPQNQAQDRRAIQAGVQNQEKKNQEDPLAQYDSKVETAIRRLTYEDFAALLGTYNRGTVEFANEKLVIKNNSALMQKKLISLLFGADAQATVYNRLMRERVFAVLVQRCPEKEGVHKDIKTALGLDKSELKSLPLERDDLADAFRIFSNKTRSLPAEIKSSQKNGKMKVSMAKKAIAIFDTGNADETAAKTSIRKKRLKSLLKRGRKLGVDLPEFKDHNLDGIAGYAWIEIENQVYLALTKIYSMIANLQNGRENPFDENTITNEIRDRVAAMVLNRFVAGTEEARELRGKELDLYLESLACKFADQALDDRKTPTAEILEKTNVAMLSSSGSEGLEEMVGRQLWLKKSWVRRHDEVRDGRASLVTLCDSMKELNELMRKGVQEGLCNEDTNRLYELSRKIDELMLGEKAANMQLVVNELKETRFELGFSETKKLIDSGFLFYKNAQSFAERTRTGKNREAVQPKDIVQPSTLEKLALLDDQAKRVVSVLRLETLPRDLVKENNDGNAQSLVELHRVLKEFTPNSVCQNPVTVAGVKANLVQRADNSLYFVVDRKPIPLTRTADQLVDVLEEEFVRNVDMYGEESANQVIDGLDQNVELPGVVQRTRRMYTKYLAGKTGKSDVFFSNLPMNLLSEYALNVKQGNMLPQTVIDQVNAIDSTIHINGEETLNLIKKMEEQEIHHVSYEETIPKQVQGQREFTDDQKKVLSFVADVLYSKNTWEFDEKKNTPGMRLYELLSTHKDTLFLISERPEMLDELVEEVPLGDETIKQELTSSIHEMLENKLMQTLIKSAKSDPYKFVRGAAFKTAMFAEWAKNYKDLADTEAWIDKMLGEKIARFQQTVSDSLDGAFAEAPQQQEEEEEIGDFAVMGDGERIEMTEAMKQEKRMEASKKKLEKMMENSVKGSAGQGKFTKTVLENYFEHSQAMDQRAMFASMIRNAKPKQILPQMPEDVATVLNLERTQIEEAGRTAEAKKREEILRSRAELNDELRGRLEDYLAEKERLEAEGQEAPEMTADIAEILNTEEAEIDKAGEIAREKKRTEVEEKREELPAQQKKQVERYLEEVERLQNIDKGNMLGGLLKGAGPLLQKMLQGMPTAGLSGALKGAFEDMKSNLAPIPETIVKAKFEDIIERSKGNIERIEVVRALGAASVGQTFLCKVYGPGIDEKGRDVAIKLLRPDVRNRMLREKSIMLMCARKTDNNVDQQGNALPDERLKHVGGMEATYLGQLKRIEEELDLTIEARNAQKGSVYDTSFSTVKSMKVDSAVAPATESLVLEFAEGDNVAEYTKALDEKLKKNFEEYFEIDKDGNFKASQEVDGVNDETIRETLKAKPLTLEGCVNLRKNLDELSKDLDATIKRQQYLIQLVHAWVYEAIFGEGFYHGDLHAGNIMVSDNGLTVIDYGNATALDERQKKLVTQMVMGATVGDTKMFRHAFHQLLENTPESVYQDKRNELTAMFNEVFALGDKSSAGPRIATALLRAQNLGIELPPAIFNFSQCQMRLENAVKDLNQRIELMRKIKNGINSHDYKEQMKMNPMAENVDKVMTPSSSEPNYFKRLIARSREFNLDETTKDLENLSSEEFRKEYLEDAGVDPGMWDQYLGIRDAIYYTILAGPESMKTLKLYQDEKSSPVSKMNAHDIGLTQQAIDQFNRKIVEAVKEEPISREKLVEAMNEMDKLMVAPNQVIRLRFNDYLIMKKDPQATPEMKEAAKQEFLNAYSKKTVRDPLEVFFADFKNKGSIKKEVTKKEIEQMAAHPEIFPAELVQRVGATYDAMITKYTELEKTENTGNDFYTTNEEFKKLLDAFSKEYRAATVCFYKYMDEKKIEIASHPMDMTTKPDTFVDKMRELIQANTHASVKKLSKWDIIRNYKKLANE